MHAVLVGRCSYYSLNITLFVSLQDETHTHAHIQIQDPRTEKKIVVILVSLFQGEIDNGSSFPCCPYIYE
jgi:hypothetical protein